MTEFAQFDRLIDSGVGKDVTGIADRENTRQKKNVRGVAKTRQDESTRAP
jgi:hypothetical protein